MTIYYVATNGNDGNRGNSVDAPLATLQAAVDKCRAGDSVLVRGGTYRQTVEIARSGAPNAPITIDAFPGQGDREQVVIDGNMELPEGRYVASSVGSTPYGTLMGFVWTPMVRISGSYVVFRHMRIVNGRGVGIWVQRPSNSSPYNHDVVLEDLVISNHRRQTLRIARCEHITVRRVEVSLSGTYAPFQRPSKTANWSGALRANDADHIEFIDCICHSNWGEGMDCAKCDSITFSNCIAYDNWRMNLYANRTTNILAENCLLYYTDNTEFRGLDGHNPPNVYLQNEEGKAAGFPPLANVIVRNCIAINGGYNLNIGNGQQGVSGSMTNVKIYNNTFVNAEEYAVRITGGQEHRDFFIRNNIFYQPNGKTDTGGGNAGDIGLSHNLWWADANRRPHANLRSPQDIYVDPGLVRADAPLVPGRVNPQWYQLANARSAAINAGIDLGRDVRTDFFGGERNTYDIGAHEFDATPVVDFIFADFYGDLVRGVVPLTVQFTDRSASTNGIETWQWLIDGVEFSTASDPTYIFNAPGTYTITLRVTGPDGSDVLERADYIVAEPTPVEVFADFTADAVQGNVPLTVRFTDLSSAPNGIETRQWLVDDQEFSADANPIYTFDTPGVYTVVLNVTGPDGMDTLRREDYILVTPVLVWPVRAGYDSVQSSLGVGLRRGLP